MPSLSLIERTYFYEDVGEGVPLLLLHGFPFTSQSFAPQLSSPPPGARLLVPDHRGFGRSDLGSGVATMEAMAEDALALLDALSVDSALVGGVSMGGYVAQALTRLDPGRVRGLVLIDTQSTPDDEAGRARREAVAKDVEANGVDGLADAMVPKLVRADAPESVRESLRTMMRAQRREAVASASRGMALRTDGKDILSRFHGPCAVIVGEHDQVTPVEKARLIQSLVTGAELHVVPGAAHLPNLEQPEAFNSLLERFVANAA